MIASVSDIRAVAWSPRLAHIGEVVEDLADIAQCIAIIVTTPRGSDPHRPRFGADLQPYIDMPGDQGVPGLIREITDAIREWEPRAEVIRVASMLLAAAELAQGRRRLRIEWRLRTGGAAQTTEVTL